MGALAARAGRRRLLLGTGDGALELLRVQPPGGRAMDAAAYLRGHLPGPDGRTLARDRAGRGVAPCRVGPPTVAPARVCAYAVLRRVFERGRLHRPGAARGAGAHGLDARDRALAMRLAYGAVQRRGTLDHLIEQLAGRPAQRLDAPRAGGAAAGLLRAAVSARRSRPRGGRRRGASWPRSGAGRARARQRGAAPHRARGRGDCWTRLHDDTPERAAVTHSHPQWIARLWWEELGRRRRPRAAGLRQRARRGARCARTRS